MFEKRLWKSDILSKDAGRPASFLEVFFKHFASKNQLPGLAISGTLVENELMQGDALCIISVVFQLNSPFF